MSRGLGRVQRAILATLAPSSRSARPAYDVHLLARLVYPNGPGPTEAQLSAVRRAVRGLVRAGLLVEREPVGRSYPQRRYASTADPPKVQRRRRGTRRATLPQGAWQREMPSGLEAPSGPSGVDVSFVAACDRCGGDADWTHTWDDRYVVTCPTCDGKRPANRDA
jgi:hypothetical protein